MFPGGRERVHWEQICWQLISHWKQIQSFKLKIPRKSEGNLHQSYLEPTPWEKQKE